VAKPELLNKKSLFPVQSKGVKFDNISPPPEELPLQDDFSDTTSAKRRKKWERKEARRKRREARVKLKEDDPFSYYFGRVDPDTIIK
jgi:hypothetical protein